MTSTDANKQIVEEFITALFTDADLTAVDRYLDPGFVNHDPPMPGAPDGPDGMRQAGEVFRRAFPDWRSEVQQLIAEDDLVAENFTARGTHRASLMGETPTGREVVLRGVNIFRIADGKIVERWGPPRRPRPASTNRAGTTATCFGNDVLTRPTPRCCAGPLRSTSASHGDTRAPVARGGVVAPNCAEAE